MAYCSISCWLISFSHPRSLSQSQVILYIFSAANSPPLRCFAFRYSLGSGISTQSRSTPSGSSMTVSGLCPGLPAASFSVRALDLRPAPGLCPPLAVPSLGILSPPLGYTLFENANSARVTPAPLAGSLNRRD